MNGTSEVVAKKYPKAMYFCGSVFSFTNFSYYGMKLVLLLFIAESTAKGGLGLSNGEATSLLASFMAFSYLSPIVGGWISDRFLGPKLCVIIGMIISGCGYFLAFMSHSKQEIQLMIVLCVIGSGLYKSTSQTLVGSLFENDDPRKDGAFSMTYMFTNVGVLLGPFLCGLIANQWFAVKDGGEILEYGYRAVFLTTAIVIWFGAAFFAIGQKFFLKNMAVSATAKENLKEKKELAKVPLTTTEKRRMCVILILAFFTIFFWIAYNQASMSIALYMQNFIDLRIGNFQIPTAWIDSYNGLLDLGETFKNPAWGSEHFSKNESWVCVSCGSICVYDRGSYENRRDSRGRSKGKCTFYYRIYHFPEYRRDVFRTGRIRNGK